MYVQKPDEFHIAVRGAVNPAKCSRNDYAALPNPENIGNIIQHQHPPYKAPESLCLFQITAY